MVLITKTISDFPTFIFNILTYMGVSRTHIEKLPNGQIQIRSTTGIPFLIYAIFHINSWCKGAFLVGLFLGWWNLEMQFFDYIAGLSWFLIFIEICIGDWLLMRKYPFFEVLKAGLRLQNQIHGRLGPRAEEYRQKQNRSAILKVWFQWIIILMGIAACIVNFASAPKYCIFTNALIEADTPLINWVMGFHDCGFIVNAWMLYGADIAIQSVFGGQLQHTLTFMTDEVRRTTRVLQDFVEQRHRDDMTIHGNTLEESIHGTFGMSTQDTTRIGGNEAIAKLKGGVIKGQDYPFGYGYDGVGMPLIGGGGGGSGRGRRSGRGLRTRRRESEISEISAQNGGANAYTIDELIIDYRKLWLYANEMNECCSYNFGAIHVIAYIQMTCDVFAIFQLLRTPGSDPTDVAYFIEDCIVCMYLLYKCFRAISFVGEKSDCFLASLDDYVTKADPRRAFHRRAIRSLPKIVMKLGPASCGPPTVGNASLILMNYYIMVALWK